MHTSDQSSDEQTQQKDAVQGPAGRAERETVSRELPPPSEERTGTVTGDASKAPRDEDILTGLVYPPPPSFYLQTRATPRQSPSVPRTTPSQQTAPAYRTPDNQQPAGMHTVGKTYRAEMPPPPLQPVYQPTATKSYTWIWALVCTLIAVVLGSCGLIAWIMYSVFSPAITNSSSVVTDGQHLATQYFSAMQSQEYTHAYTYLNPQGSIAGLTQEQFIARAQQKDQQEGPIQDFTVDLSSSGSYVYTADNTVTSFSMAVNVSRAHGQPYLVHLTFHEIGNTWKIVDFDQI